MAESEWSGRVRVVWPSTSDVAESEWSGRVRVTWPNPNDSDSESNGRVPLAESENAWPSPNGLAESEWSGRVRMGCRIILAESDWLAESEWSGQNILAE